MGKTADFYQAIWSDPWFLDLAPEAKLLYVWGFTNEHSNMAGLFAVGRRLVELETGLHGDRFGAALQAVHPKLLFHEPTGTWWVVGRAKRVRSKTVQIAKSVARAVKDCQHPPFRDEFLARYGQHSWLRTALREVHLNLTGNRSGEPTRVNLVEVPSQSQSQLPQAIEEKVGEAQTILRDVAGRDADEMSLANLFARLPGFDVIGLVRHAADYLKEHPNRPTMGTLHRFADNAKPREQQQTTTARRGLALRELMRRTDVD